MWREPKTDWKPGDAFNVSDYNRIKGNQIGRSSCRERVFCWV